MIGTIVAIAINMKFRKGRGLAKIIGHRWIIALLLEIILPSKGGVIAIVVIADEELIDSRDAIDLRTSLAKQKEAARE
jgi:hypothetical protein